MGPALGSEVLLSSFCGGAPSPCGRGGQVMHGAVTEDKGLAAVK